MAFQPDYLSQDTSTNDSINFDQIFNFPEEYHDAYNGLTLSHYTGILNTPEFEIPNPFASLTPGLGIDQSNEPSLPYEPTYEDIELSILDTQVNENGMESNFDQTVDTQIQERIAAIENDLRNAVVERSDSTDVQAAVDAIHRYSNAILRIHTQPVAQHRFRYRTDGIRYLEQSRNHPMSITLPRLDGCLTKSDQSFWLQATIITTQNNPHRKVFLHQHELVYNAANAQQNGLQSFRIPLSDEDIRRGRKTLRHLSVIKTLRNNYRFELTPFDPLMVADHMESYTLPNEDHMSKMQKAKRFDREYHTNNYQIVCQLMIKQRDQWYMTDLYCQTHVVVDN